MSFPERTEAALAARKPFLNNIQADTIEKSWRLPNPQETRFLVFTTMAYGGRGKAASGEELVMRSI